MIQWLTPTRRVIDWRPLALAVATILALGILLQVAGADDVGTVVLAACGLLAAATVLAFDDPAHALLSALPTTVRRRHGYRLALVAPSVLGVWVVLGSLGRHSLGVWPSSAIPSLVALCGVGLLSMVVVERRRPDVAVTVGAVVSAGWVVAERVAPSSGWTHTVAVLWVAHPWPVAVATLAAAWLAAPH